MINGYLRFIQSQINLQSGKKPSDTVEESEMPYQIDEADPDPDDLFDQLIDKLK